MTLYPSDDTYIRGGSYRDKNYGAETEMLVSEGAGGPLGNTTRQAHFKFDLSSIQDLSEIKDARLYLYSYSDVAGKEVAILSGVETVSYTHLLNELKAVAADYNKPVFTTETCWGALDDDRRAEIVRRTLQAHKACGLGCVVHALWYSRMPDLHTEEDGPVGYAGNLCFIDKDGTIRKGHEVDVYKRQGLFRRNTESAQTRGNAL